MYKEVSVRKVDIEIIVGSLYCNTAYQDIEVLKKIRKIDKIPF